MSVLCVLKKIVFVHSPVCVKRRKTEVDLTGDEKDQDIWPITHHDSL